MSHTNEDTDTVTDLFALFMRNSMHNAIIHSRESGLSMPQIRILMILHKKQACAIKEIAEELDVSTPAISQIVDRMLHDDLILRTEDPNDRRVKQISLTDKGVQVMKEQYHARRAWLTNLAETLSEDEKEKVDQAFEILVQKLRQMESSNSEHGHSPKP